MLEIDDSPWFGAFLLALQTIMIVSRIYAFDNGRIRVIVLGLMIAAQAGQTANTLLKHDTTTTKAPMLFSAGLLWCLAISNVIGSLAVAIAA